MSESVIQVDNLVKRYGATLAVDGISFQIGKGEIVGFLGPNGAGKSTTMKIITGYLKATSGKASVCGFSVGNQIIDVQRRIGYLPESAPAYQDMEVGAYLGFIASMRGLWPRAAKKAIDRVLDITGLRPRWRFPIDNLSRGYKQRVGLAAAMLHDPEVLILDEPTSGLDPVQIVDIREVIQRIGQEKTVIFSTHIMQEVEAICNRVILIDQGQLLADGDFKHLRESVYTGPEKNPSLELIFRDAVARNRSKSETPEGAI